MYCTPQDLSKRFGEQELLQILHQAPPLDLNHPKLMAACLDAKALCDGYLICAVSLPLPPKSSAFALLVALSADIARFRLHDDQVREGGEGGKTAIRLRYEDALKTLSHIANGTLKLDLGLSQSALPQDSPFPLKTHGKIAVVSSPVVFDQKTLNKM